MHHTVIGKTSAAKQCQTDIFRFRTRRGAGDDACGSRSRSRPMRAAVVPARRELLHMSRGVVQRQMTPEHANFKTPSIVFLARLESVRESPTEILLGKER